MSLAVTTDYETGGSKSGAKIIKVLQKVASKSKRCAIFDAPFKKVRHFLAHFS